MRLDEAGQHFRKAVEVDLRSAKAHLCLGVIYLFQYQNGVAVQNDPLRVPDESGCLRPLTPAEVEAEAEKERAQIAEQNATNAPNAEEHLKNALELEPRYEQAMEYLGALYFWWRDPATAGLGARHDDARQMYTRIAEINPRHRFATYVCGLIDDQKASAIIGSIRGFPRRPLADEESRRSLRAKVAPLLKDSAANFLRSLEIDPNNSDAMTSLGHVRSRQAYIAESTDESARFRAEADEWYGQVYQSWEADAKATGQPWPPGDTATIIFDRAPGKPPIPSFPPDARFMVPPSAPPPPPQPGAFSVVHRPTML
jgi:tetratricopeptide (TPR) repeat protein